MGIFDGLLFREQSRQAVNGSCHPVGIFSGFHYLYLFFRA